MAGVNCTPEDLAEAAKCFACLSEQDRDAIKIYLLSVIAQKDNLTREELVEEAKCYVAIPVNMQVPVMNYLLCSIING